MAITRRQFVTRMGALAAAAGLSQGEVSKIMDALAYTNGDVYNGTLGKPRVVWIHGAECTGCSTSLLSFFEDLNGESVVGTGISTATALTDAGALPTTSEQAVGNFSGNPLLWASGWTPDQQPNGAYAVDVADVVVDVIDLLYHETVMGPAGDLAYQWLVNFAANNADPYVMVVEGALQNINGGGAWNDTSDTNVPWCSIAHSDAPGTGSSFEVNMSALVQQLAEQPLCLAIVAIGQCATFGGYPHCKPPITATQAGGFNPALSQTGALGTAEYLATYSPSTGVAGKVINAPGCPTNPWWFVLTVVLYLIDAPGLVGAANGTIGTLGTLKAVTTPNAHFASFSGTSIVPNPTAVDATGRLKHVYGTAIHSPYCPRYRNFVQGQFAAHPGDAGCLQLIGCKGPAASSLCGVHGWNAQQPTNNVNFDDGLSHMNPAPDNIHYQGGHCTRAGHPCMACTEKGYPDSFVPFVKLA